VSVILSVGLIPSVCGVHKALNVLIKRGVKSSPFLFVCSKIEILGFFAYQTVPTLEQTHTRLIG